MRSYECPNCGAELKVKDGDETCYCEYCDSVIDIDDTIHIKNHYIDDAKIKELELERLRLETREREKQQARENYEAEKEKWKGILKIWIIALGVTFVFATLSSDQSSVISQFFVRVFSAVLIFGGIGMFITKPKEQNQSTSRPSNQTAFPVIRPDGTFQKSDYTTKTTFIQRSSKSKTTALILCVFLGLFGGHYFYVRRYGMGILYLCTYGLFCIGWICDIIRIANGSFKDADDVYLV